MVTESKGTTVVAGLIHKGPTVSYRYTTLVDATASLHSWVKKYGTGKRARIKAVHDQAQAANDSARIRQLEKEVSKLREERDILRKAAKYFA